MTLYAFKFNQSSKRVLLIPLNYLVIFRKKTYVSNFDQKSNCSFVFLYFYFQNWFLFKVFLIINAYKFFHLLLLICYKSITKYLQIYFL